ncbi:hypothetical protein AAHC03_025916 [Spirometra sp. Aus1]
MLPPYGIRGGQLSELLLINNGNAGDFLELFKSSSFSISCLWLLQPCFSKTARIVASTVSVLERPQTPVTVATGQRSLLRPSEVPETNQHCLIRGPKQREIQEATESQAELSEAADRLRHMDRRMLLLAPLPPLKSSSARLLAASSLEPSHGPVCYLSRSKKCSFCVYGSRRVSALMS